MQYSANNSMKNFFCLGALLLSFIGYAQMECTKFKTGTFKVTDPASKKVCIIKREGDIQTERLEDSDQTCDFDIVWLDDCTYTLTPTASTLSRNKNVDEIGTMTVKIIKVTETSYTHRVSVAANPKFRRIDEVFIVKED